MCWWLRAGFSWHVTYIVDWLTDCFSGVSCFRKRVNLSHGLFSHTVESFEAIMEMPRPLVSAMAVDRSLTQLFLLYIYNAFLYVLSLWQDVCESWMCWVGSHCSSSCEWWYKLDHVYGSTVFFVFISNFVKGCQKSVMTVVDCFLPTYLCQMSVLLHYGVWICLGPW